MLCIIYLLLNIVNGKIYIGQTWNTLKERMANGEGYINSIYLYNAINKYGVEKFQYTVLEETDSQEVANELEVHYMYLYNSRNPDVGYNIKEGGSNGKHSPETILKMKQNASKPWLGKHLSEETKKKISEANTGNLHTEEWKQDISAGMMEWHKNNTHPMEGKHHTEEAKQQMSDKLTGVPKSPESVKQGAKKRKMTKKREQAIIAAYLKGDTIAEIVEDQKTGNASIYRVLKRNNITLLNNHSQWTGKKHSEETKAKMSDARTDYWDDKKKFST